MKVAITGHTSGIGKTLFDFLSISGYECKGFSRSNGYDISNPNLRSAIISLSNDCDIFINNAYKNFDNSQFLLLKERYNNWISQEKIILNVSSRITDFPEPESDTLRKYWETKKEQDTFCQGKISYPQIINLKLGYVDTPRVKNITYAKKLKMEGVIKIMQFILDTRKEFKISTLTIGV
jgi:hypothetical protein